MHTRNSRDRTIADRLFSLLHDASFGRGGIEAGVRAVAETRLARSHPADFVEAVTAYETRINAQHR